MARNQSSRGGNRHSNNNNSEGRNQYSGLIGMARERPATAAAVAAGAAAAGVFLWSKRGQISEQLSHISDQLGEWTETMGSRRELEMAGGDSRFGSAAASETGGEFGGSAIGGLNRGTTARAARPSAGKRSSATSGLASGSGTMSGGSLDTGPSGRGRE